MELGEDDRPCDGRTTDVSIQRTSWIRKLFNCLKKKVQSPIGPQNAKDAYLMATYGVIRSDEERYRRFTKDINETIRMKSSSREFFCVSKVPIDLTDKVDEICNAYLDLGYTVKTLDTDAEKENGTYLIISWSNKWS